MNESLLYYEWLDRLIRWHGSLPDWLALAVAFGFVGLVFALVLVIPVLQVRIERHPPEVWRDRFKLWR